jgi:hypothetical protein
MGHTGIGQDADSAERARNFLSYRRMQMLIQHKTLTHIAYPAISTKN